MKLINQKTTSVSLALLLLIFGFEPAWGRDANLPTAADLKMSFVPIRAGTFMMGSPESELDPNETAVSPGYEIPQHQVTLTKDFEMQTLEVTQDQWFQVMGFNPSFRQSKMYCPEHFTFIKKENVTLCSQHPVEQVSWDWVQAFIQKLNQANDGYHYRLPTEAEWEYAARAGSTGPYGTSGDLNEFAQYQANNPGLYRTLPVGLKKPNPWGLYDMHGNIGEWTSDWYGAYDSAPVTDPVGKPYGEFRVVRGGDSTSRAFFIRSAFRDLHTPSDNSGSQIGFRLVRTRSR